MAGVPPQAQPAGLTEVPTATPPVRFALACRDAGRLKQSGQAARRFPGARRCPTPAGSPGSASSAPGKQGREAKALPLSARYLVPRSSRPYSGDDPVLDVSYQFFIRYQKSRLLKLGRFRPWPGHSPPCPLPLARGEGRVRSRFLPCKDCVTRFWK